MSGFGCVAYEQLVRAPVLFGPTSSKHLEAKRIEKSRTCFLLNCTRIMGFIILLLLKDTKIDGSFSYCSSSKSSKVLPVLQGVALSE